MKALGDVEKTIPLDKDLLSEIKAAVHGVEPMATIILFGSTARGTRGPESDYDLLILLDGPVDPVREDRIDDSLFDLELKRGTVLLSLCYSREEWARRSAMPLCVEIQKDGIQV